MSGYRTTSDCIIIGGGVAGLAAWQELHTAGLNAVVLEARDRLGGRVWTDFSEAELGAEFVHGEQAAFREDLRHAGLSPFPYENSDGPRRSYLLGDQVFQSEELDSEIDLVCDYVEHGKTTSEPDDIAVATLIDHFWPQTYAGFFAADRFARTEGGDPATISVARLRESRQRNLAGWRNHRLSGPYSRLVDYLAEGVPVETGVIVTGVNWSDEGVSLDSASGHRYEARSAILTVPLGLLKTGRITFDPAVPDWKQLAIDEIGMGHANKVVLLFRSRWWPDVDYIHSDSDVRLWWRCAPAVCGLVGFSGGPAALSLASRGDVIVEEAIADLRSAFGDVVSDTFSAGLIANWSDDPFSLGAYSYDAVRQPNDARLRLSMPLNNSLFFAGEATCLSGRPGTVDGALESGIRAALEVIATLES